MYWPICKLCRCTCLMTEVYFNQINLNKNNTLRCNRKYIRFKCTDNPQIFNLTLETNWILQKFQKVKEMWWVKVTNNQTKINVPQNIMLGNAKQLHYLDHVSYSNALLLNKEQHSSATRKQSIQVLTNIQKNYQNIFVDIARRKWSELF